MHICLLRGALLCATLLSSAATLARVEVQAVQHKSAGPVLAVRISEDIAPGDYEALRQGILRNPGRYAQRVALLDSIGGSAAEAINMGRLLRETGFAVLVPSNAVCQGSCIYLLAAGQKKTVHGHVGLHRPYFAGGDSVQARHDRRRYSAAAYLKEMGVASSLAEQMQKIPPARMRVLSARELAHYGLN